VDLPRLFGFVVFVVELIVVVFTIVVISFEIVIVVRIDIVGIAVDDVTRVFDAHDESLSCAQLAAGSAAGFGSSRFGGG
jgi:hypothetical protein